MAKAATPLTVTVTSKLVGNDWGSPPETKKKEKRHNFLVDEFSFNCWLARKWMPHSVIQKCRSDLRTTRRGGRDLGARLDFWFFFYCATFNKWECCISFVYFDNSLVKSVVVPQSLGTLRKWLYDDVYGKRQAQKWNFCRLPSVVSRVEWNCLYLQWIAGEVIPCLCALFTD